MSEELRESSANMGLKQAKYDADAGLITRVSMRQFYKALNGMLDHVQGGSVFDAGCGEGEIIERALDSRFKHIVGADLDSARLEYAKAHAADLALVKSDLKAIPLPDNSFDLVICLEVLEHVGQPQEALKELHRVTRRHVIVSVPNEPIWRIGNMARGAYWSDWGNTPEHINHWSLWGFKRFVSPLFHVRQVANPMFLWSMLFLEKR